MGHNESVPDVDPEEGSLGTSPEHDSLVDLLQRTVVVEACGGAQADVDTEVLTVGSHLGVRPFGRLEPLLVLHEIELGFPPRDDDDFVGVDGEPWNLSDKKIAMICRQCLGRLSKVAPMSSASALNTVLGKEVRSFRKSGSRQRMNSSGESGHPCLTPEVTRMLGKIWPLTF